MPPSGHIPHQRVKVGEDGFRLFVYHVQHVTTMQYLDKLESPTLLPGSLAVKIRSYVLFLSPVVPKTSLALPELRKVLFCYYTMH